MPARPYVKPVNRCKVDCFPLRGRVFTAFGRISIPKFLKFSSELAENILAIQLQTRQAMYVKVTMRRVCVTIVAVESVALGI